MTRQKDGALTDTTLPPKDPPSMCNKSTSTVKTKQKKSTKAVCRGKKKRQKNQQKIWTTTTTKNKKVWQEHQTGHEPTLFLYFSSQRAKQHDTGCTLRSSIFKKTKNINKYFSNWSLQTQIVVDFLIFFQADSRLFFINAALRPRKTYGLLGTRGPGWPPRLPRISWAQVRVQCCFTSTEAVRTIGDGEPGRPTRLSPSSWALLLLCCLMSSDVGRHIRDKLRPMREHVLYVHGNRKVR